MSSPLHSAQTPIDGIHISHRFVFADETAKTNLNDTNKGTLTITASDIGSIALQSSDSTFWILTDNSPVTWSAMSNIGATGSAGGDLSGTYPDPSVSALTETSGPTSLTLGTINDGTFLARSGSTVVGVAGGFNPANTIIVAKSGGAYTTIEDGITAANALSPSASNPITILVYSGVYTENNPLYVPSYVTLMGVGRIEGTVVKPNTVTDVIFDGYKNATISQLLISGANGVGGIGLSCTSGSSNRLRVIDVFFEDCETGIFVGESATTAAFMNVQILRLSTQTVITGIRVEGGARAEFDSVRIFGVPVNSITNGLIVDGTGSSVSVNDIITYGTTTGLYVLNDSTANIVGGQLVSSDIGFRIDDGTLRINGVTIRDSTTYDAYIGSTDGYLVDSCSVYRHDKIYWDGATTANILAAHLSETPGDRSFHIIGQLQVGSDLVPTESTFGGGDSHIRNMSVFLNSDGETGDWLDITSAVNDLDGYSHDIFIDTTVGNCIYVGGDYAYPGLKVNTTKSLVISPGSVASEYWNGSAWVSFSVMVTKANTPYTQYGQSPLVRVDSEQIRFGTMTDWATKALNGTSKYWARYRITIEITTIAQVDQFKIHTDRTEINADGALEYFGAAEPVRSLAWHRNLLDPISGSSPSNTTINISANIVLATTANRFVNNATDALGAVIIIPKKIDTSRPLFMTVHWYANAAGGDVEANIDYAFFADGYTLDGTIAESSLNSIISVPGANILVESTFEIPISNVIPDDMLAIKLYRDATGGNPNDTNTGDVVIVDISMQGTFWR